MGPQYGRELYGRNLSARSSRATTDSQADLLAFTNKIRSIIALLFVPQRPQPNGWTKGSQPPRLDVQIPAWIYSPRSDFHADNPGVSHPISSYFADASH